MRHFLIGRILGWLTWHHKRLTRRALVRAKAKMKASQRAYEVLRVQVYGTGVYDPKPVVRAWAPKYTYAPGMTLEA